MHKYLPIFAHNTKYCSCMCMYVYLVCTSNYIHSLLAEVIGEEGLDLLMASLMKEVGSNLLLNIVARGNAKVLEDILKKSPEKVSSSLKEGCIIITQIKNCSVSLRGSM